MKIITLYSRDYRSNTYILSSGKECFVFDPGMEIDAIIEAIASEKLTPCGIILTHGHFDHIFSLDLLRKKYSTPVYIHEKDAEMLTDSHKNAYSFFFSDSFTQADAEKLFTDGDKLYIGDEYLEVIHTPGHSLGSSCFLCDDIMITGDTLFSSGIGRTDLYGGDHKEIFRSLGHLRSIGSGKKITIYPGHGGSSDLQKSLDNTIYF